ncbi:MULTISPECIES: hypothetical protein [unclassified Variovorax]|uniref:hypothetical protein n=1 Tax=unclassified Variovorax TaxID=663243 RepID=UPI000F7ED5D5|nr:MULTISPECIES: hypothetical protein [unclassified Variovorax]RSZ36892.1 hypothetical protein EJO70_20890 [Variovorax sp. 553]RSZ37704.1 hypothetical protein EJO71_20885 [Variovorax sp. 679]
MPSHEKPPQEQSSPIGTDAAATVRHAHEEFYIDLPLHWKALGNDDPDTLNFQSEAEDASIILSLRTFETLEESDLDAAERNVNAQIEFYSQTYPGRVETLWRMARPHSGGVGAEMSYAVDADAQRIFLYLGYVTQRKLVNLLVIGGPDREKSKRLFFDAVSKFRAKSP